MEIRQNAKGREQNEGECSEAMRQATRDSQVQPMSAKLSQWKRTYTMCCQVPVQSQDNKADKPPARNGWV